MKPVPPESPTNRKPAAAWIITGLALILGGVVLLPTVAMTAVGIGLIICGAGAIAAAIVRAWR